MGEKSKSTTAPEHMEKALEASKVFLVKALNEVVVFAKKNYYNGRVTISDEAYDVIESSLTNLCPNHPAIGAVGDVGFEFLLGYEATRDLLFPKVKLTEDQLEDAL